MKIRILKGVACPPWNIAAFVGQVITVTKEMGAELIEAERAEAVSDKAAADKAAPAAEKATAKAPAKAENATKK